jgi:hypothetical protein
MAETTRRATGFRGWRGAMARALFLTALVSGQGLIPRIVWAQPPIGPFYGKTLNWVFGVTYERIRIDPNLPRDLRVHDNHPEDAAFLTGSAGETDLDSIEINAIGLEAGVAYRLGYRSLALIGAYVPKIAVTSSGRLEMQQANDQRAAAIGSYVYSQLDGSSVAHAVRTGLGAAFRLSDSRDRWLEIQGLVDVGRWDMTFEKGWTRFGRDQAALSSEATGVEISPRLRVSMFAGVWAIQGYVAYTQIQFSHQAAHLEHHVGTGLSLGFGGRVMLPPRPH